MSDGMRSVEFVVQGRGRGVVAVELLPWGGGEYSGGWLACFESGMDVESRQWWENGEVRRETFLKVV